MRSETQEQLANWGRWARGDTISDLGYHRLNLALGNTVGMAPPVEDSALRVESAVTLLRQRDEQMAAALVRYYVRRQDIQEMGRALGTSRKKAGDLLHRAESWVDGVMEGIRATG